MMGFLLRTACNDLRRRLRDPLALLLWMAIPMAIGGLIRLAFGGSSDGKGPQAEVWVADQDDSFLSGLLLNAMASGAEYGLPILASPVDLATGQARIEAGRGSALLIIPEGFGEALLEQRACELQLITNPAQSILPGMVEHGMQVMVDAVFYVQQLMGEPLQRMFGERTGKLGGPSEFEVAEVSVMIQRTIKRSQELLNPPLIQLEVVQKEVTQDSAPEEPGFAELFFPSMLFMALFFMASGIGEDFWVEKQQGTLRRALMAPHPSAAFLGGKLLGAGLLMGAVALLGMLLARYAFGVQLHNVVLAGLWACLSGAFLLLMVLPLQLFASSQKAGDMLTNLVMMPLMMIGGSFFPFESMPEGMATIGRATPNGWALSQFKRIILDQHTSVDLGLSLLGVLLVGGLLFLVANRRLSGAFGAS